MALRKINGEGSHYFVPYGGNILRSQGYLFSLKNLTIGSFIERDKSRAALISIHADNDNNPVNTVSVEYAIETTTDGKKMVSAHFRRND